MESSAIEKSTIRPVIVGSGRKRVKLESSFQGDDLLVRITGGEAHVGAVAVWNGRQADAPATVTELPHHREGPLAGDCAEILGRATGRTVVTVVGIHQDEATREEIESIVANAKQAAREAAEIILKLIGSSDVR